MMLSRMVGLACVTMSMAMSLSQSRNFKVNRAVPNFGPGFNASTQDNMNGEYMFSPTPGATPGLFPKHYKDYPGGAESFDVYSPPITTLYSQVWWSPLAPAPFPDYIIKKYAGKGMAIVGWEIDQVRRTPEGDVSVPISASYNHHYTSSIKGASAEFEKVMFDGPDDPRAVGLMKDSHGMVAWDQPHYLVKQIKPSASGHPVSTTSSSANGGEYRKSYHGFPPGYALVVDSPNSLQVTPMQIDTWNRNTSYGDRFIPGPESTASQAPPHAEYSGHLECPCTDRIKKTITETYTTQYAGRCASEVGTPLSCFSSASQIGVMVTQTVRNVTVHDPTLPYGCTVIANEANVTFTFNNYTASDATCGGGGGKPVSKLSGGASSYVNFGLDLDSTVAGGLVTITITGPDGVWFGVGLGATVMADKPNAIIVTGNGTVFEQKLADQSIGTQLPTSVKVLSNTVVKGNRTVVLTRAFKGLTSGHYTFDPTVPLLDFLNAIGRGPELAYHQARAGASLYLKAVGVPTCVCSTGIQGFISSDMNPSPAKFSKNCAGEPYGDLLQDHNPTCHIDTYAGGLKCCTSGNILLDSHQNPWEDNKLVYSMKFRFWYQEFVPATPTAPASHENLIRFFHETEVGSGEYDVMKAPEGTAPEDTVYTITAHFQLKDALSECNPRTSPHCTGPMTSGVMMRYASCHCHAPSCLSCELYNADTGDLICRQTPVTGTAPAATHTNPYDELGYIAVPPCLYGPEDEGLVAPPFLSYDQNLTSIKKNNNTYGHYGEMAMWQCRGSQAYINQTSS
eukprot:m.105756 g.105756  ORF g.105756 m.105756 type:complete len:792 (-) comp27674_c0_seq2:460-2835(-)